MTENTFTIQYIKFLIYSFGLAGGLVKLKMCSKICHVHERMSILLVGKTEFKIRQSRTRSINRLAWIELLQYQN